MRWLTALTTGLVVAGLATLTGCGAADSASVNGNASATPTIDSLPGARVGELAEEQLEAENPQMAVGRVTCPELAWKVDASVRCVKVSELSEGRRVTIPGTVTVTSTVGGGKLHVALDDQITEFGVEGDHLVGDVTSWVASRTRSRPTKVRCPYLRGVRGASTRCGVDLSGRTARVRVTVTDVDPQDYRTTYSCSWQVRPRGV
jgi:hypothetical protein